MASTVALAFRVSEAAKGDAKGGRPALPPFASRTAKGGRGRKFVARLQGVGAGVLYYEEAEGGHAGTGLASGAAYEWALQCAIPHETLFQPASARAAATIAVRISSGQSGSTCRECPYLMQSRVLCRISIQAVQVLIRPSGRAGAAELSGRGLSAIR